MQYRCEDSPRHATSASARFNAADEQSDGRAHRRRRRARGLRRWPAGVAAISALERLSNARRGGLRGLSVLELGAGTGLTALAAAKFGARVVATDASELCLRLLRAARDANPDLSFTVEKLDFSQTAAAEALVRARGPFDLVVACDTFYSTQLAKRRRRVLRPQAQRGRARPVSPTRPQFADELKRLEVASWDGGADVAFRPFGRAGRSLRRRRDDDGAVRRRLCGRVRPAPARPLFRCSSGRDGCAPRHRRGRHGDGGASARSRTRPSRRRTGPRGAQQVRGHIAVFASGGRRRRVDAGASATRREVVPVVRHEVVRVRRRLLLRGLNSRCTPDDLFSRAGVIVAVPGPSLLLRPRRSSGLAGLRLMAPRSSKLYSAPPTSIPET